MEQAVFEQRLAQYADFIVRVGCNVQPGQTLIIDASLEAAPLARLCTASAFAAGARDVRVDWSDDATDRIRMERASEQALCDIKPYKLRSYMDYAESEGGVCSLRIFAGDPELYAGLDGGKVNRVGASARRALAPWQALKMGERVQWCAVAQPSAAWAQKMFPGLPAGEAVAKQWELIFDVCRVSGGDVVGQWQRHVARLAALRDTLNTLDLVSLHFTSANGTDLTVPLAEKACWESAQSISEKGVAFLPNIPTEEVFTAPHRDKVEGVVYGTKPCLINGQTVEGFRVVFKEGRVVEYSAEKNAALLGQLLDSDEGARHIGEVALVPASSPINRSGRLFYNTLFDENAACHIAFGASYPGTTEGGAALAQEQLAARGMNHSVQHKDVMIGAEDTCVTGLCRSGRTVQILVNGEWAL